MYIISILIESLHPGEGGRRGELYQNIRKGMVATHTERRALRASEVVIDHISMKLTVNVLLFKCGKSSIIMELSIYFYLRISKKRANYHDSHIQGLL